MNHDTIQQAQQEAKRPYKKGGRPQYNKKNGAKYYTLKKFVERFYKSHFNRDPMHDVAEGEEYDNSTKHRIYGKAELYELAGIFADFFSWVLIEDNIGLIFFNEDIHLVRQSRLPSIRRANEVDLMMRKRDLDVKPGDFYVTKGKYIYILQIRNKAFERMKEIQAYDPEFIKMKEELQPIVDERNANAKKHKDESSE